MGVSTRAKVKLVHDRLFVDDGAYVWHSEKEQRVLSTRHMASSTSASEKTDMRRFLD